MLRRGRDPRRGGPHGRIGPRPPPREDEEGYDRFRDEMVRVVEALDRAQPREAGAPRAAAERAKPADAAPGPPAGRKQPKRPRGRGRTYDAYSEIDELVFVPTGIPADHFDPPPGYLKK